MIGQITLDEYLKTINREGLDIKEYIPVGSVNAVTRQQLSMKTGLRDRHIRHLIHYARRDIPILNMQDGTGYFIPDMNTERDRQNLERYVKQEESRLKSTGWALKAARTTLKNCGR